jgi:aryl-alcohol dehydrogenase-like predicted oxidoreductase
MKTVTPICLGTMTFGEQVNEADAHAILDRSLERGVNFLDTAEMYAVPARAETFGATETIIGNWFAQPRCAPESGAGHQGGWAVARHALDAWRGVKGMTGRHHGLVRRQPARLQTDVIDLYQIHWPERHVPAFGACTTTRQETGHAHPRAAGGLAGLVKAGKVRAHRPVQRNALWRARICAPGRAARPAARGHGAKRVLPDQPHLENALDETMHRLGVSLLAYSPLAFGLLTGKYDESGIDRPRRTPGRAHCQL